jgi:hypothetical protein
MLNRENIYHQDPKLELEVGSTNGYTAAPTAITDGVELHGAALKGPRYINLLARIRNAANDAEGTTAINVLPYFWHIKKACWIATSLVHIPLESEILADTTYELGNSLQIAKPQGCNRVYLRIPSGTGAGNVLHAAIECDT